MTDAQANEARLADLMLQYRAWAKRDRFQQGIVWDEILVVLDAIAADRAAASKQKLQGL